MSLVLLSLQITQETLRYLSSKHTKLFMQTSSGGRNCTI